MCLYNVYDEEQRIVKNGGMTAEETAAELGITVNDFLKLKFNSVGYICHNNLKVRKDTDGGGHIYIPLRMKEEWDRVCKAIRGAYG